MRKYINYNNSKAASLKTLGKNILVVEIYLIFFQSGQVYSAAAPPCGHTPTRQGPIREGNTD